ncbi:hypothetical protein CAL7102_05472 [Dulcicalothrix desertica PCC 7102]|nr:hypothetical protein CAL7102_05472 [Dulcicalothrix desertica PCC 7102]
MNVAYKERAKLNRRLRGGTEPNNFYYLYWVTHSRSTQPTIRKVCTIPPSEWIHLLYILE